MCTAINFRLNFRPFGFICNSKLSKIGHNCLKCSPYMDLKSEHTCV